MGKLVIVDECLAPRRYMYLYYEGPDPVAYLAEFRRVLMSNFEVELSRARQTRFMWDYTGDPIHFYDIWEVRREFSRFTTMVVHLRFIGYKSKTKNEGNFTLEVSADLRHTFEPSNWLVKYVWLLYLHLFYNKWRRKHVAVCRDYLERFRDLMRERYNMKPAKGPRVSE